MHSANIMIKVDSLHNTAPDLHRESNHPGKPGNFQGRTSSCTGDSNPGNNPSAVGKQSSCDYSVAVLVSLADRMMTECSNMPTPMVKAEYTGYASSSRDKAETLNGSSICSRASDGSELREQPEKLLYISLLYGGGFLQTEKRKKILSEKVLLETILLGADLSSEIKPDGSYVTTSPSLLKNNKKNGLVKNAVADFFKNSTHDFSPFGPLCDQIQTAKELLCQFARTESGQRLYRKAVANNLVALERLLRWAGVDINHQSPKSGNTPIIAAALANHWTMVSLLLDAKVSVDKQNKSDEHLLELIFSARINNKITTEQQHELTLKVLESQPKAQIKVAQGKKEKLLAVYAFQFAVTRNYLTLCDALLQRNAFLVSALKQDAIGSKLNMDEVTDYYDLASATSYLVNLKDNEGWPLFNLNCKTDNGKSLLRLAHEKGNNNTVMSLVDALNGVQNVNVRVFRLEKPPQSSACTYAHHSDIYQDRLTFSMPVKYGAAPLPASSVKKRASYKKYGHSYSSTSHGGGDSSDCGTGGGCCDDGC